MRYRTKHNWCHPRTSIMFPAPLSFSSGHPSLFPLTRIWARTVTPTPASISCRRSFASAHTPVRDTYGYNHRSEVTSARRTLASNPSQEVRGFSYDYAYDPIGNRVSSTEYDPDNNPLLSAYTANALNQYEQRTIPSYAAVRGSATNTATVTVNGNPTWRLNDYFYGGDEADNSTAAIMKELQIIAAHSNHYSAVTGSVFVAQTPETFTYDDDGNLTQDGRWQYTWDAENRLIGITTRADLPASVPHVRITHRYDHQSRRIATTTAVWTNSTWQSTESRGFTYDGWNVISEVLSPKSGVLSTNLYVWGLDLSGSLQSAGGIGGLLSASFGGTTALYTYDANGNVSQLIDPATSDLLAHYEYDPFGKTIVSSGHLAQANPFRFSTKWFDSATGLGDWGYRWYSPNMGRWLSFDMIDFSPDLSLYAAFQNAPSYRFDLFGLASITYSLKEIQLSPKDANFKKWLGYILNNEKETTGKIVGRYDGGDLEPNVIGNVDCTSKCVCEFTVGPMSHQGTIYIWKGLPAEETYLAQLEEKMHYQIDKTVAYFTALASDSSRVCEYSLKQSQDSCEKKAKEIRQFIRGQWRKNVDDLQINFDQGKKTTKEELEALYKETLLRLLKTQDSYKNWKCNERS